MQEPRLPKDWRDRALACSHRGLDAPWFRQAQQLLRSPTDAVLTIESVVALVARSCGIEIDASAVSTEALAKLQDPERAIAMAWQERAIRETKPGRPAVDPASDIPHLVREFRSQTDELQALYVIEGLGFELYGDREPAGADWPMRRAGRKLNFEIKSKGPIDELLDIIHAGICGVQLLEAGGAWRRCDWELDIPITVETATSWATGTALHEVLVALFHYRRKISQLIDRHDDTMEFVPVGSTSTTRIDLCDMDPHVELRIRHELASKQGVPSLVIYGERTKRTYPWYWNSERSTGGHLPEQIDRGALSALAFSLERALLRRDARQMSRQFQRFGDNSIFVVRAHLSEFWDDALADHEEDLEQIVVQLTKGAEEHASRPAIALWPSSFNRLKGAWWLNARAAELLEVDGPKLVLPRT